MLFKTVAALAALAVGASAQTTTISPDVRSSILMALATALPTDSVSYILASPDAFASAMASSLSAGNTPSWYQALPSDVTNIMPALYPVTAVQTPAPTYTPSSSAVSAAPTGHNSTAISDVHAPTLSSASGASGSSGSSGASGASVTPEASGSAKPTNAQFTGGASLPSAAVGAGIAGALGFLGMLAL